MVCIKCPADLNGVEIQACLLHLLNIIRNRSTIGKHLQIFVRDNNVDQPLGGFIEDKNALLPIDAAIQSNLRETTTRVLASLTPREERVLRMRFGIGMNTDHTLEEVGL